MNEHSIHDRVRAQLDDSANRISIADREPASIRSAARQRTVRRHRVIVGGVAAATVAALVAGVQQMSADEGPTLRTSSEAAPNDQPATQGTAPAAAQAGLIDARPAELGDPAFVWKVVDPGQANSVSGGFGDAGLQSLPALMVSTAPGRSNDYDNLQPRVWRTDDGVSWEETALESPFSTQLFGSVSAAGHLFALGTAPGIAATDPNPLQVAIAGLDSDTWTTVDLPTDTNQRPASPLLAGSTERTVHRTDDGVLVAITPATEVNLVELAKTSDAVDLDRIAAVAPEGLTQYVANCDRDDVPASTVVMGVGGAVVSSPEPTTGTVDDACSTYLTPWGELGVGAADVDAWQHPVTEFFHVGIDGSLTAVDSPAPGQRLQSTTGGSSPDFVVIDTVTGLGDSTSFRYVDGTWRAVTMPITNWAFPPAQLGDTTVGFGWDQAGRAFFAALGTDGSADYTNPVTLFDQYSIVQPIGGAVAGDRLVAAVADIHDSIAEAGGIEFTKDGITVRRASMSQPEVFLDAATRVELDESQLQHLDDGTIVALDTSGAEIGRVTWDDVADVLQPETEGDPASWSILTTADGIRFSSESVADLLGLDPSQIRGVSRVSSDGTQVIVTVTLSERYPDDTNKQLVLVGTPIG